LIKFEKFVQDAKFRNPLEGFKETSQQIEVRVDPLTGRRCRINVERAKRPKQAAVCPDIGDVIQKSRPKCFFCPENIEKVTPMFAEGMPDRIKVDKACVFPNLFPFAGFHAVGIFSGDHCLAFDMFTPDLIEDCLQAALQYFKLVQERHPEIKYWHINWNNLPPGAASIIHPHIQMIADAEPTLYLKELLERSKEYHKENGTNYWEDLVKIEKDSGERYIGQKGSSYWLSSFSPRGNKEITAVVKGTSSLAGLEKSGLGDLSTGLSAILGGWQELCVQSFTMSTFSGPSDNDDSDFYWLNARIIARPNMTPYYTNDAGFMERLHAEPVTDTVPEHLAKELQKYF